MTVYFSICSANYLPLARTLHASLTKHEPGAAFVLFLADEVPAALSAEALPFEVVEARQLGIENFADMAFRYDIMEFNTAIKPFCFLHLMDRSPNARVVYLDPDIYVTGALDELTKQFDAGAELILTPHALAPLDDGYDPDDQRIMQTGAYNLGFAAMQDSADTRVLLHWWASHMRTRCISDLPGGLFVDQKFMDMAPAFVEQTHILRHRGYNAAYWNLHERPIKKDGPHYLAGPDPLVFFHFSGVDRKDPNVFSRHQNRFSAATIGDALPLLDAYKEQLRVHDDEDWSSVPYAYGRFRSGETIPDVLRRVYRKANLNPVPGDFEDIFQIEADLYLSASEDLLDHSGATISRLQHEAWRVRPDLRALFNLGREKDRQNFVSWFNHDAMAQFDLPAELVPDAIVKEMEVAPAPAEATTSAKLEVLPSLPEVVRVAGYLKTESGLGEAVRGKLAAFQAAGLSVLQHPLRAEGFANLEAADQAEEGEARILYLHVNADQTLRVLDRLPSAQARGAYRIGYWAWELPNFPEAWREAAERLHEVWVPSAFVRQAVSAGIDRPVSVVPHPVKVAPGDRARGREAMGIADPETLIIGTIFDTRSFMRRKNPLGAIEAFQKAFPDPEKANVRLVLKSHGPLDTPWARHAFSKAASTQGVIVRHSVFSSSEMDDFHAGLDILLSMHRSEGFGLNIAQAMAKGKVAVATGWSGNMDFMSDENSVPLRYDLRPLAPGDYPFSENQQWAEPSMEHAVEVLQRLHEDFALRHKIGHAAKRFLEERFSVDRVAEISRDRLNHIFSITGPQ